MPDEAANRTAKDADRRLFLEKAGRFAAVTPPVVALMLSASGKARAFVASGGTHTTTTTYHVIVVQFGALSPAASTGAPATM